MWNTRCAAAIDLALTTTPPPPSPSPPTIATLFFSLLALSLVLWLPFCHSLCFSVYLFHLNVTYKSSHFQSVYIRKERVTRIIFSFCYTLWTRTHFAGTSILHTYRFLCVYSVLFSFILSFFFFASRLNNLLQIYLFFKKKKTTKLLNSVLTSNDHRWSHSIHLLLLFLLLFNCVKRFVVLQLFALIQITFSGLVF